MCTCVRVCACVCIARTRVRVRAGANRVGILWKQLVPTHTHTHTHTQTISVKGRNVRIPNHMVAEVRLPDAKYEASEKKVGVSFESYAEQQALAHCSFLPFDPECAENGEKKRKEEGDR